MNSLPPPTSPNRLLTIRSSSGQEVFTIRRYSLMGIRKIRGLLATVLVFLCLAGAALVTSVCQAISYVFVRPLTLAKHRQICLCFSHAFLLSSSFLLEKWSGITFKMYGDRIDARRAHLCVINHYSNVDWLLGLAFIAKMKFPYPGNAKSVVKASLGKVPLFGSILHFAEFLFLTRSWEADRDRFLKALLSLRGYAKSGFPLWFTLYPEGTRLTPDKLEASQAYAVSKQLPPLEHVLFPRFKAFTSIVSTLREDFDGVVDATIMFEGDVPTIKTSLAGSANTIVHAHVKYFDMKDLPIGEEQLESWLLERWSEKDKLIANFKENPSTLGSADAAYFPIRGVPSLRPFYGLVITSFCGALATMYVFSKIPNGLYFLLGFSLLAIVVTAIFTALNLKPSEKGGMQRKTATRRRAPSSVANS